MYRVLLIDEDPNHAERLALRLRERGLVVLVTSGIPEAARQLSQRIPVFEIVIMAVEGPSERWLGLLRSLIEAARQSCITAAPLFLLASRRKHLPHIRLRIEHLGARYAHE